ncbi:5'-methylthioadenosine/S-adenosylhomocysteine nucleosidase [Actinoplanes sp. TBRC 11911]|uniref:5'-methylthioadenosine/S-adenosylhomocysteine nucleosidase family protein n=1 Tax=Actinoplanes sp. TBRC 11911 TaxID=2729386 RepID=UPI00145F589F|nr:5'-methylthioadenosine/S-adenosylhomocysteine nucleosidase [Actinoplanes sp. TBRC 11911]NMO56190.1 5'-methylthioadenosine/S-adenosylhomocysteine nucleosidase [Actinoplanes sp. TBRC 11911]
MTTINGGFNNFGGSNNFYGPVAGNDVTITAAPSRADKSDKSDAEIGVLTVIDEEMRAVTGVLAGMDGYRTRRLADGPLAHEARLTGVDGRPLRIAAVQTLTRGTESAALACRALVEAYGPSTVLLVGIAGGVAPGVRIGDVVIADNIISYDARKVTPQGTQHRGQSQVVPAPIGHRLNEFFQLEPRVGYRVHRGPIGSGNAVVADPEAEIRHWLHHVNDKVLAVETEAAGVAQSFHETARLPGWLTIRGISDTADQSKNDDDHAIAARHAAEVMAMLVPFLDFRTPSTSKS